MGGHMQHPPYPIAEFAHDGLWASSAILGAVFARIGLGRLGLLVFVPALALVAFRLILGSLGGMFTWPI